MEYMDEGSATVAKDALHNYKLDGENKIKASIFSSFSTVTDQSCAVDYIRQKVMLLSCACCAMSRVYCINYYSRLSNMAVFWKLFTKALISKSSLRLRAALIIRVMRAPPFIGLDPKVRLGKILLTAFALVTCELPC